MRQAARHANPQANNCLFNLEFFWKKKFEHTYSEMRAIVRHEIKETEVSVP